MRDIGSKSKKESYITFLMNDEHYAITVAKVTELLEMVPITKVPRVPDFMRGVINLRGEVVPIIDSRLKFALPPSPDTIDTCIVVMHIDIEGRDVKVGVIVDSVSEVIEIEETDIMPLPSLGNYGRSESIIGVIKMADQITMVLDVDIEFQKDLIAIDQLELAEGVL